jgi:signal transduction histidine kinase
VAAPTTSSSSGSESHTAGVVLNTVPALLAYINREQRYVLTNDAFRAWFDDIFGDTRGRTIAEVLGPAAYELVRPHVEAALAGKAVSFEARIPHAAGPRWVQTHYVPHCGADGSVLGFVSQIHDISDRKLSELRLSTIADASRALGESVDEATAQRAIADGVVPVLAEWSIVFVVRDGSIVPTATAHIPRVADNDLQAVVAALTPDPEKREWCALRQVLDTREHVVVDAKSFAHPSQVAALRSLRCVRVVISPLIARGRAIGALLLGTSARSYDVNDLSLVDELARRGGAALDTTLLLQSQSDAVQRMSVADRRKDEFLALLGHELRNPLAPIVTALDLLDLRCGPDTLRERVAIRRQAVHLTRLIDDLLDVSRITRGKLSLDLEQVDLGQVLHSAIEDATPLVELRRHYLRVDIGERLYVQADPVRLAQVFSNLLTNAAKYTDPGGQIVLRAWRDGGTIKVVVEDNGTGISPDLLPDIFEAFVQSPRTIDRSQGGLGLGLALVRSLTQLHGGSVSAQSDGHGKGSRFTVELPACAVTDIMPVRQRVSPQRIVSAGDVLIVDDNVDAATMLADALRVHGFTVTIAHSAPAALEAATQMTPKIALLDLGLPVVDGFELARRFREHAQLRSTRLIAVTGYGAPPDVVRCREAGFDQHFSKPLDLDTLVKALL